MTQILALAGVMTFFPMAGTSIPQADKRAEFVLDGRRFLGKQLTVLVVFGADCKPCAESIPFYKRLSQLPALDGKAARLVVWTQGGVSPVYDVIEKHPQKFTPHTVVSFPTAERFDLKGVPTILLVDARGRRLREWPGRLTRQQEQDVLGAVTAARRKLTVSK